jgi:hypothetical protein
MRDDKKKNNGFGHLRQLYDLKSSSEISSIAQNWRTVFENKFSKSKGKVKLSPWLALEAHRMWDAEDPTLSGQSAYR